LKRRIVELILVAGVLALITGVLQWTDADRFIARLIWRPGQTWPGIGVPFWRFLYHWAPLPAFVLAFLSLAALVRSFLNHAEAREKKRYLFLLLALVLGPGLLVNTLLKDQLGRPRPRELTEFGGRYQYVDPLDSGPVEKNSSFPSGHASVAFYLLVPWFVYRDRHRVLGLVFLFSGLGFGVLVGMARIFQGAHFVSDVLWAGGLVYLVAGILALVMRVGMEGSPPEAGSA